MNILMISSLDIWSLGKKSGAQDLYETIKGYTDNNHNITYLTDRSGKKIRAGDLKLKNFIFKFFNLNIDFESWKSQILRSVFNKIKWILFQAYVLFCGSILIYKKKIDIIYAYEIFGIPAAFLLKFIFTKPLITRFQGTILKPKLRNQLNLFLYIEHTIAFILCRFSDLVIMANDGTEGDCVLNYFKVPKKKVRFWINGINADGKNVKIASEIRCKNRKIQLKRKKILVTLSRLASWKRVDRIIKVMPDIIKKIENVLLIIVGDGEEKDNLKKIVQDCKISNYVYFTGALPHQKAIEILNRADIFVSLYDLSNVGNPLLEAMKLGKCIVTLNTGYTGRIIKNNKTGMLLGYKDLRNNLSNVIINLLKNEKDNSRLRGNAFIFAQKNFCTWKQRMNKEVKEVKKIIANY